MLNFLTGKITVSKKGFSKYKKIQSAIDAAKSGSTVYIEEGIYQERIKIKNKHLNFIGLGRVVIEGDALNNAIDIENGDVSFSKIKITHYKSEYVPAHEDAYAYTICVSNSNFKMENCSIEGDLINGIKYRSGGSCILINTNISGYQEKGVRIEHTKATLENCEIYNCGDVGLNIVEGVKAYVKNCKFYKNKYAGVLLTENTNTVIDSCQIFECNENILIEDFASAEIKNCTLSKGIYANINHYSSGNVTVNNCTLEHANEFNIALKRKSKITVEDSKIHNAKKYNIYVTDAESSAVIKTCEIFNATDYGICVDKNAHIEIHNCKINNNYSNIKVANNSTAIIKDSFIAHASKANVALLSGANFKVSNSTIRNAGKDNIYCGEKSTCTVENTSIIEAQRMGIFVTSESKANVYDSKIHHTKEQNVAIQNGSNVLLQNCELFDSPYKFQLFVHSANLTMNDCKIYNCKDYAAYLNNAIIKSSNTSFEGYNVDQFNIFGNTYINDEFVGEPKSVPIVEQPTPTVPIQSVEEVTPSTASEQQKPAIEILQDMVGLKNLKQQITSFINIIHFNKKRELQGLPTMPITLHSVFLGNPGTGKTTVARLLGRLLVEQGVVKEDKFIEVSRKDLVAEYIGHTAKQTQAVLEKARGGILFIDEAYTLYKDSNKDFGYEAIETILKFMEDERDEIMIIFAGYTNEMQTFLNMNSGLASRIPNRFEFDDYTADEIAEIGYKDLTDQAYQVEQKLYSNIVKNQYVMSVDQSNARWIRNFNQKLLLAVANRFAANDSDDTTTILESDLLELTGNKGDNKEQKIQEMLDELHAMVGLNNVKQYVQNLVKQVKIDKLFAENGEFSTNPTYHMVFEGNPGTGKTTVANIISSLFYYLDILPTKNVVFVDRSNLVGSHIGETEKLTTEIIKQSLGGVLFIDEAYQLTTGSQNDFGKQAVETMITYLENYSDKFIVIFAGYTNEMNDFLATNPGLRSRIPNKITFEDYSPQEIAIIIERIVSKNWFVNKQLLAEIVIDTYAQLPALEKSNGRWARNFSEKLIQMHKVWISDKAVTLDRLKYIQDEMLEQLRLTK